MSHAQLDSLKEQGITAILNLCAEFCDLHEIEAAQRMMKREGIKWLDSTAKSIEEISTIILQEVRLDPPSY